MSWVNWVHLAVLISGEHVQLVQCVCVGGGGVGGGGVVGLHNCFHVYFSLRPSSTPFLGSPEELEPADPHPLPPPPPPAGKG